MKQVLQSLKSGRVEVAEIPTPLPDRGQVLIHTTYSLVSLGTEKMLLEFGKAGWVGKARQQPEKVRQVVQKVRTDGIGPALQAVNNKLDRPIALGYCNVGTVASIGHDVIGFAVGDRVVSNGPHAEMVCVNEHLVCKLPDSVSDLDATFAYVAAIGLQGIRLLEPSLGETYVVLGLGLIGLLSVQLLRANGCRVIGFDYQQAKVDMAERFGASAFCLNDAADPVALVHQLTHGFGCDGVLITASTASHQPVRLAPKLCRPRGRISLVGVCELDLSREDFYKKELSFQVSCSYGPGRYDPTYEQDGLDYPIGFVRWTEERNVRAVVDLMAGQRLDCAPLITKVVDFASAPTVYADEMDGSDTLGLIFKYPHTAQTARAPIVLRAVPSALVSPGTGGATTAAVVGVGLLGAGGFVGSTLLPGLSTCGVDLVSVCSKSGVSAHHIAKRFGFTEIAGDENSVVTGARVNTIVIATPHHLHAVQALAAIQAGKHVFVEKPLATTDEDIDRLETALRSFPKQFLVGFNRRFAPLTVALKNWLGPTPGAASFVMNINAGSVDANHWTQDRERGGGRLIGECCHFVDLLRFLADSPIDHATAAFADTVTRDTFSIHLRFASGALGIVNYFANGHRDYPKERLEVFHQNQVVILDNFKKLVPFGARGLRKTRLFNQDKGHRPQFHEFFKRVREGGAPLIPYDQLIEVARWCVRLEHGAL